MRFPETEYMTWAKTLPRVRVNLARSGIEPCPASLLRLAAADLVINLPAGYGYLPLREAIGRRYGVGPEQVFPVSGGASFANWLACAATLDGSRQDAEVIVERPTYEPLLRIAEGLGGRIRRFDRRFEEQYEVDLERFATLVTSRTRLAIVTNLHNPSGARIEPVTLAAMAATLRRVGAHLLVDEVYLECLFGRRGESSVHAGSNVVATNSLTKAYGLDGLRAGWILGPRPLIARAGRIHDLLAVNGVAPGERLALSAFRHLGEIRRRARAILDPNLDRVRRFLEADRRLDAVVPPGGNVIFPGLPRRLDSERLARHLRDRYSTLVVPGRFFESPGHIRISFGLNPARLERGLANIARALDDLGG